MSNLEPGCKAIVVRGFVAENIGKIVTVVKYIGAVEGSGQKDLWEVDQPMISVKEFTGEKNVDFINSGKNMQRIDDHPELTELNHELEEFAP